MKVERDKVEPKFEPVVITLETKGEVDLLWHLSNCAWATGMKQYCDRHHLHDISMMSGKESLWHLLNGVYQP